MLFISVTLEVSQPEMSALKFCMLWKRKLMSVTPETHQPAMAPYFAMAEAGFELYSVAAAFKEALSAKRVAAGAQTGGLGGGGEGLGGGGEGEGGGVEGGGLDGGGEGGDEGGVIPMNSRISWSSARHVHWGGGDDGGGGDGGGSGGDGGGSEGGGITFWQTYFCLLEHLASFHLPSEFFSFRATQW